MSEPKEWLIYVEADDIWWKADAKGYTKNVLLAGLYTEADAKRYEGYNRPCRDRAIHVSAIADFDQMCAGMQRLLHARHGAGERLVPSTSHLCGTACINCLTVLAGLGHWRAEGNVGPFCDGCHELLKAPVVITAAQEVCLCAAIQMPNGYIVRGHRHDDCLITACFCKRYDKALVRAAAQGFMTSRNRFVDRAEGMRLMRQTDHAARWHGNETVRFRDLPLVLDELFSEHLY